jgi:hypothetical protein
MDKPQGYNPMRWNCKAQGKCYNLTLRPRIEEFAGCFPGRISMSDVDGIVEIGGHFLLLEWKSAGGAVTGGQRIMFEQLTALSTKITVVVVSGEPREPTVEAVQVFRRGVGTLPEPATFEGLKVRIEAWANRAAQARIRPSRRTAA